MRIWIAAVLSVGLWACQTVESDLERPATWPAALQWLDRDADHVAPLTTQPAACIKVPVTEAVQRGELLFNSPSLLGGNAAKIELSCAACHRNGRGNPDFVLLRVSGGPGTADVTHGFFSSQRADRAFNPVAIPDLASPAGRVRVDRESPGVLEDFLIAQIVEEFAGKPPAANVLADLAAYIRALDDRVCDASASEPVNWRQEVARVRLGLAYMGTSTPEGGAAYVAATRAALGRIYRRYPFARHLPLQDELRKLSYAIQDGDDLTALTEQLDRLETTLRAEESNSLYDAATLAEALSLMRGEF